MEEIKNTLLAEYGQYVIIVLVGIIQTLCLIIIQGLKKKYLDHCSKVETDSEKQWKKISELGERIARLEGKIN